MEIPRHWRLKKQRYALFGDQCPHCEHKMFPPRDVCTNCGAVLNGLVHLVINSEIPTTTPPRVLAPGQTVQI